MSLDLTIAFSDNPLVQPLRDGAVKPKDIALQFVTVDPGTLFYRNLKFDEFDVSEMGIPWTIRVMEMDNSAKWDWAKLPVFLSRGIGWNNLYVNTAAGIAQPQDIRGKRLCFPEYNMSLCMWFRIILNELYGIKPQDNLWYNARAKDKYQAGVLGIEEDKPDDIALQWLPENETPDAMLERGEIDAAVLADRSSLSADALDRYASVPLSDNPKIRKLFPDGGQALIAKFYRQTEVRQLNHHVIVQNRILRKDPWVAMELFNAFERSKELALEQARRENATQLFKSDPYALGVKAMRKSFDRYIRGMLDGRVIKRRFQMEEVYYPTTIDT